MNVVIFGATGSVGRHVTAQAVEDGHSVTAFTRSGRPPEGAPASVRIVTGDVRDAEAVANAVAGQDAVICVLGAGMHGNLRAPGTANIIAGMKRHGVRRLICQSTLGAGDSVGNLDLWWRYVMFGLLLRRAMADHEAQEALVRASDLDWTILRPAAFTDGPRTGAYRIGFPPDVKGVSLKISRADVADFILRELGAAGARRTLSLSY